MSKGTTDDFPWSAWKWDRTPEARAAPAKGIRTARRASLYLVLLALSCGRSSPQKDYDLAWKAYQRGELATALKLADTHTARHTVNTKWHWEFRLLQAETLIALGRTADAEKLLAATPPRDA